MISETDFYLQCRVPNIRGYALQLQRLEDAPVEQAFVCAAEFAQVFNKVLVSGNYRGILFRGTLHG